MLSVHRLPHASLPHLDIHELTAGHPLFSVTVTPSEVSVITTGDASFPEAIATERDWAALKMQEPEEGIDFSVIGLLAEVSGILAAGGISIFAVSTYLTDWILLKQDRLEDAEACLEAKGWEVRHVKSWVS